MTGQLSLFAVRQYPNVERNLRGIAKCREALARAQERAA